MLFKWKDKYSVNIKEVDKQHKKLFEIGNELYTLVSLNDGIDRYDEIMKIIEELKDYAIYHFNYEEKLMKEYGYEEFNDHKQQHDAFVNKILDIEKQDIDGKQNIITMDILNFIADWIEKHIIKSDLKYKDFFNQKGLY
ncbi:bacteriohemerythrin [Thermohalobacter berrensis]|uniref:Bacteriohemerythrin n=1 Tax=Thermohalobacter berrensis TaxID=99594 RepID=A0A419T8W5_9FIRM|nr:bacteriohemerythrin [Thermohalobacter berrensis]RKD33921.1 bacteriohemerythrin [Thermohalobacter berrensis]